MIGLPFIELKRPKLNMIFKRNLNRFLGNPSYVSFMYVFLTKFLIFMLLTLIFHCRINNVVSVSFNRGPSGKPLLVMVASS